MKEVVRKKLRLDARASISFAQIRDGKSVDLEDGKTEAYPFEWKASNDLVPDDDFDAFYALAHSTNSVDVKVTVVEQPAEVPLTTPMVKHRIQHLLSSVTNGLVARHRQKRREEKIAKKPQMSKMASNSSKSQLRRTRT